MKISTSRLAQIVRQVSQLTTKRTIANTSIRGLVASSQSSAFLSVGYQEDRSTSFLRPSHRFLSSSTGVEDKVAENAEPTTEKEEAASNDAPTSAGTHPVDSETREFQAETRQLLDIVTNSLYTDKEVFLRELVSNASDALEKLRHVQLTDPGEGRAVLQPDLPLEIRIEHDEVTSSITISDTGVGMTKEEMIENLGTIARSGSKNFLQELQKKMEDSQMVGGADPARGIIGKFGVGFYSAFMVADRVQVTSRSAVYDVEKGEATPAVWTSDGSGTYDIGELEDGIRQDRGSSVKIFLKDDYWSFVDEKRIEDILKRYSNFVGFPITLNGTRVNTIEAIWTKDPKEVEDDEYAAFYKFIANAVDDPLDIYHFRADAPLDVKALFFIPSFHSEKYGMGRMEPGVSLYSRKILIESQSPDILPGWLRFVRGVVDSEDLPLAISREKPQDSALIGKLRRALTRKFIAHLAKMVKNDRETYVNEFFKEYAFFLKEGICQDFEFQAQLSKLLYFETSKIPEKEIISLDEYIAKMRPEQKDIYYLVAPTRDAALNSPYLEAFERASVEVILLFSAIDDFVMANLESYEGRKLVSVETGDIDLSELTKDVEDGTKPSDGDDDGASKIYEAERALSSQETLDFCNWFRAELGDKKVASCTVTTRLVSSPAIVTDNESGAMRRLMRMVDTSEGNRDGVPLPKQHVEINPKHPVIVGIHDLMKKEPTLARVLAEQVFDNCLVAAGLLDDSRSMLPRLNDILICVVNGAKAQNPEPTEADTEDPSPPLEVSEDPEKENEKK